MACQVKRGITDYGSEHEIALVICIMSVICNTPFYENIYHLILGSGEIIPICLVYDSLFQ